jgi:hypothetical protein
MSSVNTQSDSHGRADPFFVGFEKFRTVSNGNITKVINLYKREVPSKKNDPVVRISFRISGIASNYFPNYENPGQITPRAKSLEKGLLIGMHAGALALPRIGRKHYFAYLGRKLDLEGGVFGGFHTDSGTIDDETSTHYRHIGEKIALPKQLDERMDGILESGVGWMATELYVYRLTDYNMFDYLLSARREKNELSTARDFFGAKGEITTAILDN